jgi:hypothetical protein
MIIGMILIQGAAFFDDGTKDAFCHYPKKSHQNGRRKMVSPQTGTWIASLKSKNGDGMFANDKSQAA